jgi:hypothetical protein
MNESFKNGTAQQTGVVIYDPTSVQTDLSNESFKS